MIKREGEAISYIISYIFLMNNIDLARERERGGCRCE